MFTRSLHYAFSTPEYGHRCASRFLSNWKLPWDKYRDRQNTDGLVQERRNSTANALELRLACTNSSIWRYSHLRHKTTEVWARLPYMHKVYRGHDMQNVWLRLLLPGTLSVIQLAYQLIPTQCHQGLNLFTRKTLYVGIGIPTMNSRWSYDRLEFILGIPVQ